MLQKKIIAFRSVKKYTTKREALEMKQKRYAERQMVKILK